MDPIEAAIQAQINNIQNQQGFSNYTPSFEQNLQPQGIAPLVDSSMQNNFVMSPTKVDPKQIAGNILKNQAIKFAGRKLGLDQIGQNVLGSVIGYSQPFAPLAAVSALTGVSSGIANVLRNKRVEKAIMRDINRDKQGDITTVDLRPGMQPTPQDTYRGGGGKTQASSSKSAGTGNPYGGGPGGVQSGL